MSRGSSFNQEATEFYKSSKPILQQLTNLRIVLETSLLKVLELRKKQRGPVSRGELQGIDIVSPIKLLSETVKSLDAVLEKFTKLGKQEKQCSSSLFFRARQSMAGIEKRKLTCLYLSSKLLTSHLLYLIREDVGKLRVDLVNVLAMIDVYNQILAEDPSIPKIQSPMVNSSVLSVLHNNRHYHSHIHENFCSPLNHQLKPITTSKILSMIGRERATVACKEFSTILLESVDLVYMENISEEYTWLETPISYTNIKQEMYGQGSKASTSKPTKEVFIVDMKTHFRLMEQLVENESIILHHVLSCLPQVPGLLNKSQLKEGKEGVPRLIGQVKKKMGEFYHDILWRNVGQLAEETLLWDGGKERNPVGLIHPRVSLAFNTLLKEHLSAQFGDGYPSLILPAVHIIIETFSIHAVSASWDLQVLRSLALSIRPKPQRVLQDDLSLATLAGSYFKKTINSLVHFNNLCLPDIMNDIVSHGVHDPEEFPFLEELHVLRRLKATLYTVQNWVESRSAEYIQSWRVGDFFIINHADLARIYPSFDLLQICGHDRVAASNSTSIKLFTHVQQAIALQIYTVQQKIKNLPEEENENMCRVCRTFSLACLQNVFPPQKHWNKSLVPETHSSYVKEYIEKILLPVFSSLSSFPNHVQQSVGRLAVKTLCDSWLEHIYQKKIKFSEGGAKQLALDFSFLRKWIDDSTHLREESKRYLLLLDSIRQCEGVAQLLQKSSGKEVPVKPNKGNKIAPEDEVVEDDSPVAHILEAIPPELYVTNHKKWLSLRTGSNSSGGMSLPFCC